MIAIMDNVMRQQNQQEIDVNIVFQTQEILIVGNISKTYNIIYTH
jgi:hypothetical protein